jgi:hypothetical protein
MVGSGAAMADGGAATEVVDSTGVDETTGVEQADSATRAATDRAMMDFFMTFSYLVFTT